MLRLRGPKMRFGMFFAAGFVDLALFGQKQRLGIVGQDESALALRDKGYDRCFYLGEC